MFIYIYIYYGLVCFFDSKRDNDEIMIGYSWDVPSGNETWPCWKIHQL